MLGDENPARINQGRLMKSLLGVSKRCSPLPFQTSAIRIYVRGHLAYFLVLPIQNHEEHERRWAQGSFLQVIGTHVKSKLNGVPLNPAWRLWLSMNPDSDATAIWLERKFDVPESGHWVSEIIFSISPTKDPTALDFPGLIVFECSPLEGVVDDLERFVYLLLARKRRLKSSI